MSAAQPANLQLWAQNLRSGIERHLLTILAVPICLGLLLFVPQIRYAFSLPHLSSHPGAALICTLLTVTFFAYHFATFLIMIPGVVRDATESGSPRMTRAVEASISWPVKWALRLRPSARVPVGFALAATTIALFILAVYDVLVPDAYPLLRPSVINLTGILFLLGVWVALLPAVDTPDNLGLIRRTQGRMLGWLLVTYFLGETIWLIASIGILGRLQHALGFLLYTQWAILQILFLILNVARVIDFWHSRAGCWPIRFAFSLILVVSLLTSYLPLSARMIASSPQSENQEPALASAQSKWLEQLTSRVESVPFGPAIIVACSGGGSRAALFASLVLEGLLREDSLGGKGALEEYKLGEHVVMISSVSGGSLATGYCLANGYRQSRELAVLQNSGQAEILRRVGDILDEEGARAARKLEGWKGTELCEQIEAQAKGIAAARAFLNDVLGVAQGGDGDPSEDTGIPVSSTGGLDPEQYRWVFDSQFVDDMATDFMAPILRGALTPFVSRGEALRAFWEQRFGWHGRASATANTGNAPLVFFNTCNTSWGTRLTIGFPPLPNRFFLGRNPKEASAFPTLCLADLAPGSAIEMTEAVRLSSNFPWGFRSRRISGTAGSINILDGGMVDNTGLDTVYEVLLRLKEIPEGVKVLSQLARLGVVILEVDSGSKPHISRSLRPVRSGLAEPLATYSNTLHTNGEVVKKYYRDGIKQVLKEELQKSILAEAGKLKSDETQCQIRLLEKDFPEVVLHYTFQCEHFGDGLPLAADEQGSGAGDRPAPSVMTAWALGPREKARVIARFLVELGTWKTQFPDQQSKILEILAAVDEIEKKFRRLVQIDESEQQVASQEAPKPTAKELPLPSAENLALAIDAVLKNTDLLGDLSPELAAAKHSLKEEVESAKQEAQKEPTRLSAETQQRLWKASNAAWESLQKAKPVLANERGKLITDLSNVRSQAAQSAREYQAMLDRKTTAVQQMAR